MPDEKAPSSGAFLPSSLMHHLSGEPMYDLSGVDTSEIVDSAMNSSSSEVRTQVDGIEHTKREKFAVRI
jgi:hypothetical protein